jgi:hypothetical protein
MDSTAGALAVAMVVFTSLFDACVVRNKYVFPATSNICHTGTGTSENTFLSLQKSIAERYSTSTFERLEQFARTKCKPTHHSLMQTAFDHDDSVVVVPLEPAVFS